MPDYILNKIIEKAKAYKIKKLYLFGSALDDNNFRDIDLACEGLNGWNLIGFAGEIENEILMNVDVVDLNSDSSFVDIIKSKMKLIYEQK